MVNKNNSERDVLITRENEISRRRKFNKFIIGIFLFFLITTFALKIIDALLLDMGYFHGKFNFNYWHDQVFLDKVNHSNSERDIKAVETMLYHHPHFFWVLTQFTWITTIVIIVLMGFRFFKYDQGKLPKWLNWIMSQRTLSLVTMYDVIVGGVFWMGMFKNFESHFNPDLYGLEIYVTIMVHSVFPVFMVIYSFIYLTHDKRASVLRERTVFIGMLFPTLYIIYYIVISVIWYDPYGMTNLHGNFGAYIGLTPLALLGMYIMMGFMIITHNLILFRFNKKYDPKKDYELKLRRKRREEKIYNKLKREYVQNGGWYKKSEVNAAKEEFANVQHVKSSKDINEFHDETLVNIDISAEKRPRTKMFNKKK